MEKNINYKAESLESISNELQKRTHKKRRKKKLTAHRVAYLIHSFVGLKLSLIFSIVLITGTIAVFAEEIDWLLYSEMRVSLEEEKLNEGEVFDRVKAAFPESGFSGIVTAYDRKYTAASARMVLADGTMKKVWVNPYSGVITGITEYITVGGFFSKLHRDLFLSGIGRALVNAFGVICLIGLISGVISYRRFWREFFTMPRWSAKSRVLLGDLHKFLGVWSLWFILIIGVSGSWWFYQNPLVEYDVVPQFLPDTVIVPALTNDDLASLGLTTPLSLSSAAIVDAVKLKYPNFDVNFLSPPQHNGMAYTVFGYNQDILTSKYSSRVFVNPFTAEILGERLASDKPVINRIDLAMRPLHYGTWGNDGILDFFVKLVWCIFGISTCVLSISGLIISYKRAKMASQKLLAGSRLKQNTKKTWFIIRPWGGPMSSFKYFNWFFIVVICVGINNNFSLQKQGNANSGYKYKQQNIGGWQISLNAMLGALEKDREPIQPGRQVTLNAYISKGNHQDIKFMYVSFKKPRTMRAPGSVVHGVVGGQHAHVATPTKIEDDARLWLSIEGWNGEFYQTSWPLLPDGSLTLDMRNVKVSDS
jgi:uncharacterized iron-regulated membrane protein